MPLLHLHKGKPKGAKRPRNTSPSISPPTGPRFPLIRVDGAAVVRVILEFALEEIASCTLVAEHDAVPIIAGTLQSKEIVPAKPLMDVTSITRFPDWPGRIVIGGTFVGRMKSLAAGDVDDTAKLPVAVAEV